MTGMRDSIIGLLPEGDQLWSVVMNNMAPLLDLYADSRNEEIMVVRYNLIFVRQSGKNIKTNARFDSEEHLFRLIHSLTKTLGNDIKFGEAQPVVDIAFPDHSRANCTHKSISPRGHAMTIRLTSKTPLTSAGLLERSMFNQEMLDYLKAHMEKKSIFLIGGEMGSGKTSLLRMLSEFIDVHERVISVEDTHELFIKQENYEPLVCPRASKAITFAGLMEIVLRKMPDRLLCGEIRNPQVAKVFYEMLSIGHRGIATTMHAETAQGALERLTDLVSDAVSVSRWETIYRDLKRSLDIIIITAYHPMYGRRIMQIAEMCDGELIDKFRFDPKISGFVKC
ncbi:ATPase, T2SS/T4P/T4SS family [Zooshikella sp. RANM57]|uniref:ATPase, T2SS/T4P/T4SS family n=1 Tax=Zooshikella sp. RANM57 TaxID=3425863 RepID=UPI003D6E8413